MGTGTSTNMLTGSDRAAFSTVSSWSATLAVRLLLARLFITRMALRRIIGLRTLNSGSAGNLMAAAFPTWLSTRGRFSHATTEYIGKAALEALNIR